jgi:monoamine oxidase
MDKANTLRGKWANSLFRRSLNGSVGKPDAFAPIPSFKLPPPSLADGEEKLPCGKAVIIGAGVSGLYLAMALDMLGMDYEILEATDRIGGRILTHYFPDDPTCKHNYYDIGAMRFPQIKSMYPTTRLFDELKVHLEEYILDNDSLWSYFNEENMSSQ